MALLGSPSTRDHVNSLLERGLRNIFFQELDLRDNSYEAIYLVQDAEKKTATDVQMTGLGTFQRKTEGDSPFFDSGQEAWTKVYTHNTFALGIEMTEEAMEDELYGYFAAMAKELGIAAGYTIAVEAMDLFNNLSDTVYTAGGTNYTLLNTAHFMDNGDSWSNRPTVATDLSLESLETGLADWRTNMVDQRGRKVHSQPRYLMVGPSDESLAHRLVNADKRPGGNENDPNFIKDRRNLEVLVMDHMTNDGRWFLIGEKGRTKLRWNNRVPFQMRRDSDSRTGNLLLISRYRESHGTAGPLLIYGSP